MTGAVVELVGAAPTRGPQLFRSFFRIPAGIVVVLMDNQWARAAAGGLAGSCVIVRSSPLAGSNAPFDAVDFGPGPEVLPADAHLQRESLD